MKERLLGFFNRRSEPEAELIGLAKVLAETGIAKDTLVRASHQRRLMGTRLLSTLTEQAELAEEAGLEVLCRHVGLPGISLKSSFIDLGLPHLPNDLCGDHLLLPIQRNQQGVFLLATSDPLSPELLQELELFLHASVRPHLALHYLLGRAIRACEQLRNNDSNAAYLLGDLVDPEEVEEKVIRTIAAPATVPRISFAKAPSEKIRLLLAADSSASTRLGDLLFEANVKHVSDSASFLQAAASDPYDLLVVDAMLPGKSGIALFELLRRSERFRHKRKILLPHRSMRVPDEWQEDEHLLVAEAEDLQTEISQRAEEARNDPPDDKHFRHKANARHAAGLVYLDEGNQDEARQCFEDALQIDSLHADSQRQLFRLQFAASEWEPAEQSISWAYLLNATEPEDEAQWAELLQRRGDLRQATDIWRRLAAAAKDEEQQRILHKHIRSLHPAAEASGALRR